MITSRPDKASVTKNCKKRPRPLRRQCNGLVLDQIDDSVPHLQRIQRKHLTLRPIWMAQLRIALDEDGPTTDTPSACWICKAPGELIKVAHRDARTACGCEVHATCLMQWQAAHERKGKRVRICPACRGKRVGWQPARRVPRCSSVVEGGRVCGLRPGHLGVCVAADHK